MGATGGEADVPLLPAYTRGAALESGRQIIWPSRRLGYSLIEASPVERGLYGEDTTASREELEEQGHSVEVRSAIEERGGPHIGLPPEAFAVVLYLAEFVEEHVLEAIAGAPHLVSRRRTERGKSPGTRGFSFCETVSVFDHLLTSAELAALLGVRRTT